MLPTQTSSISSNLINSRDKSIGCDNHQNTTDQRQTIHQLDAICESGQAKNSISGQLESAENINQNINKNCPSIQNKTTDTPTVHFLLGPTNKPIRDEDNNLCLI